VKKEKLNLTFFPVLVKTKVL